MNIKDLKLAADEVTTLDFLNERDNLIQNFVKVQERKEKIKKLPKYRGEVLTRNTIRCLPKVEVGEIFLVENDPSAYIVTKKDGKKVTIAVLDENATLSTGITIYEMNKSLVKQEPNFDWENKEAVDKLYSGLKKWFSEDTTDTNFMLYGKDISYFSIFTLLNRPLNNNMINTIIETLSSVGDLISMDFEVEPETKIEIWVRNSKTNNVELLYLFPYDNGLIPLA